MRTYLKRSRGMLKKLPTYIGRLSVLLNSSQLYNIGRGRSKKYDPFSSWLIIAIWLKKSALVFQFSFHQYSKNHYVVNYKQVPFASFGPTLSLLWAIKKEPYTPQIFYSKYVINNNFFIMKTLKMNVGATCHFIIWPHIISRHNPSSEFS